MRRRLTPSPRVLSAAYLIAIGMVFLGVSGYLLATAVVGSAQSSIGSVIFSGTNVVLSVSLVAIGGWLYRSPLDDEQALTVSKWGAFGLMLPTGVVVGALAFDLGLAGTTGQFTAAFATGGVVGSLYGSVSTLEREHERVDTLYHRNQVLQRVFRHNIRNGMSVVQGYSQLVARSEEGKSEEFANKIHREARAVADLADVARSLDAVADDGREPIDLVSVLDELFDTLGRHYPEADFETELPETAWVAAGESVKVALWHLLEFGIHRSRESPVSVALSNGDGEFTLVVTDDGEALADEVITALETDEETPLAHLEGMDLWVVKWLVESLGGTVTVGRNGSAGARVELTVAAAPRPVAEGG